MEKRATGQGTGRLLKSEKGKEVNFPSVSKKEHIPADTAFSPVKLIKISDLQNCKIVISSII